jgi:hypothetical protein
MVRFAMAAGSVNARIRGLTLVEAIVVVALATTLLVPMVSRSAAGARSRAALVVQEANLRQIERALEFYEGEHGVYPAALDELVAGDDHAGWSASNRGRLLAWIPVNPLGGWEYDGRGHVRAIASHSVPSPRDSALMPAVHRMQRAGRRLVQLTVSAQCLLGPAIRLIIAITMPLGIGAWGRENRYAWLAARNRRFTSLAGLGRFVQDSWVGFALSQTLLAVGVECLVRGMSRQADRGCIPLRGRREQQDAARIVQRVRREWERSSALPASRLAASLTLALLVGGGAALTYGAYQSRSPSADLLLIIVAVVAAVRPFSTLALRGARTRANRP